jgi:hypothetical protein
MAIAAGVVQSVLPEVFDIGILDESARGRQIFPVQALCQAGVR